MSLFSTILLNGIREYIIEKSVREPSILQKIRTDNVQNNKMQIPPEQGQIITILLKLMNAKHAIELGVFHGYSTVYIAMGLSNDGKVVACEKNEEYAKIARENWSKFDASINERIELKLAPALDTLNDLINQGYEESFDFIFIDADKKNYYKYYELSLILARKGGVILIDNVLFYGNVIDSSFNDKVTNTIREFNDKLSIDGRIDICMIPIGDGMTIAVKK